MVWSGLWGVGMALAALPQDDAEWGLLTKRPVPVECTQQEGVHWCRARARVLADIDHVVGSLRSMADNADKYDSILSVNKLTEDVMHITLDFPGPLSDRDYVAKYVYTDRGEGHHTLSWSAVVHEGAPPVDGVVRLDNYAGEWRLDAAQDATWVTYIWHAEYGGALPGFALPQARKTTGAEALKDIAKVNDTTYELK